MWPQVHTQNETMAAGTALAISYKVGVPSFARRLDPGF